MLKGCAPVVHTQLLQRRHEHARVAAGGVRVEELLDIREAKAHAASSAET